LPRRGFTVYDAFRQREQLMRGSGKKWLAVLLVATLPRILPAQDVRLVNGSAVQGQVVGFNQEGLQVRMATGVRTFSWDSLAPNTRFRYQPLYRANYDSVLRGMPRARWTNAPDPLIEQEVQALAQAAAAAAAETTAQQTVAAQPAPSESSLILDQLRAENVPPLQASAFPGASFRDFERSSFVGFQYGASSTDVVYFAFDCPGAGELSDVVYVYSPATPEFSTTVKVKGFKKGTGSERSVTYRKFRTQTTIGKTLAIMEFEPEISTATPGTLFLSIYITLSRDRAISRFVLARHFSDLLCGDGIVPVKGVLDYPNLWLACTARPDGAPKATLLLSMANMILIPRDGMESRASLTVADNAGNIVYRDTVKMDLFPPPLDGVATELKRLSAGQSYTVNARIDLGPFLGAAEGSDTLTMPGK
jgi:hypothetical protein